jgi:glutathione S-transferase
MHGRAIRLLWIGTFMNVELFVSTLCPFAARARLALAEKQLPFKEVEIDLQRKPDWFLQISPHGKVPLLRHDGRLVWESAVIAEYLEEVFPARPLLPAEPEQRAAARAWVSFADSRLYARTETLLHSFDPEVHVRIAKQIADDLRFLEGHTFARQSNNGAYLLGAEFTLADLALYPWFEQVAVLERYRGFRLPAECQRLIAWQQAVANRDSVRSVGRSPQYFLDAYGRLLASMTA